jgi:hypothetical protein
MGASTRDPWTPDDAGLCRQDLGALTSYNRASSLRITGGDDRGLRGRGFATADTAIRPSGRKRSSHPLKQETSLSLRLGMAAIHAALWCVLPKDGLLLTSRDLYGGTVELIQRLLPRIGATWRQVDLANDTDTTDALKERPAAISSRRRDPLVRVVDGRRLAGRANEAGRGSSSTTPLPRRYCRILWNGGRHRRPQRHEVSRRPSDLTLGVVSAGRKTRMRSRRQGAASEPLPIHSRRGC